MTDLNSNFSLDTVFKEKTEYLQYTFAVYKKIYDLKTIIYSGKVSKELFSYVKNRKFFVLLAIYDDDGKIYLERIIQDKLYWSIPGGSIHKNEDIHMAVNRIVQEIVEEGKGVFIGEIEPIAFVENRFTYKDETFTHYGIAFMGRLRNKHKLDFNNSKGKFVTLNSVEIENINRYANKEVAKICKEKFKKIKTAFPEYEISTNEASAFRYYIHNHFIKKYILTNKLKKKREFIEEITKRAKEAKSFIDVSCGDSNLIFNVSQNHDFDYLVANDVSWGQINNKYANNKKIIFTNHNVVYLPFKENSFDVAYCGNTLHHMSTKEELIELLDSALKVSKKLIIVEIENPTNASLIPYFLHKYWYLKFLHDAGGSYLTKDEFQLIINNHFKDKAEVHFSEFRNIQGHYLIAEIIKNSFNKQKDKQSNKIIELEEKYICKDLEGLKNKCVSDGYEYKPLGIENDTYFTDLDGEFIKDRTCLRIRTKNNEAEITFKGKSKILSSAYAKVEHNVTILPKSVVEHEDIFNSLGFYKYVDVNKVREVFVKRKGSLFESIVIDDLKEIGSFVEFEIIGSLSEYGHAKEKLREKLNLFIQDFRSFGLENADLPYRDYTAKFIAENMLQKSKTKAVIFDFDGTIVPSEELFFKSYQKIAEEMFHINISIDNYKRYELHMDGSLFNYIKNLKSDNVLYKSISEEEFMCRVYADYEIRLEALFLNEKVLMNFKSIKLLKNHGYKLGLVTSSKREFISKIFSFYKVENLFDVVITREGVSAHKPAPEGYKQAIKKLKVKSTECLAIEDSRKGIMAAESAGIECITVAENSLMKKPELLEINPHCLDNLEQVALILCYSN